MLRSPLAFHSSRLQRVNEPALFIRCRKEVGKSPLVVFFLWRRGRGGTNNLLLLQAASVKEPPETKTEAAFIVEPFSSFMYSRGHCVQLTYSRPALVRSFCRRVQQCVWLQGRTRRTPHVQQPPPRHLEQAPANTAVFPHPAAVAQIRGLREEQLSQQP